MISAILGLATAILITAYACFITAKDTGIFLDKLGILIVLGGTISATAVTFNLQQVRFLLWNVFRVFRRENYFPGRIVAQLVTLAHKYHKSPKSAFAMKDQVIHPFIADGLRLLENDFDEETIERIMVCSITERKNAHLAHVDVLRALAKYPPAFGMIGTVIGLVALLQGLNSDGGLERLGPNMAVALVTTLYGLLISNFVLIPVSENLFHKIKKDVQIRRIVLDGILMLRRNEDPVAIEEYLNAFLHPSNRTTTSSRSQNIGAQSNEQGEAA